MMSPFAMPCGNTVRNVNCFRIGRNRLQEYTLWCNALIAVADAPETYFMSYFEEILVCLGKWVWRKKVKNGFLNPFWLRIMALSLPPMDFGSIRKLKRRERDGSTVRGSSKSSLVEALGSQPPDKRMYGIISFWKWNQLISFYPKRSSKFLWDRPTLAERCREIKPDHEEILCERLGLGSSFLELVREQKT